VMVPKTVRLTLQGQLKPGVHARDVGFHFAAMLKQEKLTADLDYRVLEYAGDLDQFDLASRAALCSTPTEIRAYGVFVPPSKAILEFAKTRAQRPFAPVYSDSDARYDADLSLDISRLEPQVSLPGSVENAVNVSEVEGTPIEHAFIGSCGSGMWEDMTTTAAILKGRRLAPNVRLFIAPGSEATNRRLAAEGLLGIFIEAGAVMLPPGCGPCNDAVIGPVHSGEVSISTATNNNAGRFGARDAKLYLGSPATVAASAVAGKITDARKMNLN
jgi:3-isopropylmalate/(R)-2-methylmalate dehydratase large subunit